MTSIKSNSGLQALENWMNGIFATHDKTQVYLTTFVDKKVYDLLKKNPDTSKLKPTDLGKSLNCIKARGLYDAYPSDVSIRKFEIWLANIPEFQAKWNSTVAFLDEVKSFEAELVSKTHKKIVSHATEASQLSDAITTAESSTYKWLIFNTGLNALANEITDVDKEFVYNRLAVLPDNNGSLSSGQYYWKFNDGYSIIPMEKDNRTIEIDPEFWNKWWEENRVAVLNYTKAVIETLAIMCISEKQGEMVEYDNQIVPPNQIEELIRQRCPSSILRCLTVGQVYKNRKTEDGEVVVPTGEFIPALRLTQRLQRTSMESVDWESLLAKNLLRGIDLKSVKQLKIFSNTPCTSQHYLGPIPIPRVTDTEPTLEKCPTWNMFLNGKFPSPKMGKFRLASFILSVIDANNYNRQLLYTTGNGSDGKTTLLEAIIRMFDPKVTNNSLPASAFASQFGLKDAINKRLLMIDDTKLNEMNSFINSDTVKRVTGAGATGQLQIDIKNRNPIAWHVSGCKMMIATNGYMTLSDEATISRINPLLILQNYKRSQAMDQETLENKLVSERAEFIQWCADYFNYYVKITNVNGERNRLYSGVGVQVLTDAMWEAWLNAEEDNIWSDTITDARFLQMRKDAFEFETTVPGSYRSRIYINQEGIEDTLEDESETTTCIVDALFEKGTDDDFVKASDVIGLLVYIKSELNKNTLPFGRKLVATMKVSGLFDIDATKLSRSIKYKQFIDSLREYFDADKVMKKIDGKPFKGYNKLKIKPLDGWSEDVTTTDTALSLI